MRDTEETLREAGTHLMMVCMPRTCGVFSSTLSVFGSGCPWWAEARAALQRGSSGQSSTAHARGAAALEPPEQDVSPDLLPESPLHGLSTRKSSASPP